MSMNILGFSTNLNVMIALRITSLMKIVNVLLALMSLKIALNVLLLTDAQNANQVFSSASMVQNVSSLLITVLSDQMITQAMVSNTSVLNVTQVITGTRKKEHAQNAIFPTAPTVEPVTSAHFAKPASSSTPKETVAKSLLRTVTPPLENTSSNGQLELPTLSVQTARLDITGILKLKIARLVKHGLKIASIVILTLEFSHAKFVLTVLSVLQEFPTQQASTA